MELGCGQGVLLQYLRAHGFPTCIGIEPDPERAAYCRSRGLDVRPGTAQAVPLPAESCGAMVMECVYSLCEPGPTSGNLPVSSDPAGRWCSRTSTPTAWV